VNAFPKKFPRRGEIYMVDFNPSRGSEQAGMRPAVVVSNDVNNEHSPIVIVAALTRTIPKKAYPFAVPVEAGALPEPGTILCNQLMTVDKTRLVRHRGDVDESLRPALARALAVALDLPRNPSALPG
jgi:mRNA interferase MazF